MVKKAAIQANRMGLTENNISMSVNTAAGVDKNPNSAWSMFLLFFICIGLIQGSLTSFHESPF